MGIQINGNTDTVTSTTAGGRVTVTPASFPSVNNINATGISTFSGGVIVSAGSTSAPSISPTGDSNTGIFFPSPDTVAIAEGGVEALRVDSSANIQITNGNLVFSTAGRGIDFSATANSSGTMTSELLNDYEEGTWTPTVYGSSVAGTTTYTIQNGVYRKIGGQVTAHGTIRYTATTGSGFLLIGGFPFAFTNPSYGNVCAVEASGLNWTGGTYLVMFPEEGATYCYIAGNADDADRTTQNITNEIAVIRFSMTYYV